VRVHVNTYMYIYIYIQCTYLPIHLTNICIYVHSHKCNMIYLCTCNMIYLCTWLHTTICDRIDTEAHMKTARKIHRQNKIFVYTVYINKYTDMNKHNQEYIDTNIHLYKNTCTHTHIHVHVCTRYIYTCLNIHVHIHTNTCEHRKIQTCTRANKHLQKPHMIAENTRTIHTHTSQYKR